MTPQREAIYAELIPLLPTASLPGVEGSSAALQAEFDRLPVSCFITDSTTGTLYRKPTATAYASGGRLVPMQRANGSGRFIVVDQFDGAVTTTIYTAHETTGTPSTGIGNAIRLDVEGLGGVVAAGTLTARLVTVTAGATIGSIALATIGDDGSGTFTSRDAATVSYSSLGALMVLGTGDGTTLPLGFILRGADAGLVGNVNSNPCQIIGGRANGTGNAGACTFTGGSSDTGTAASVGIIGGGTSGAGTAGSAYLRPGATVGGTPGGAYLKNAGGTNIFGLQPAAFGQLALAAEVNPAAAAIIAGAQTINSIAGRFRCAAGAGAAPFSITNNRVLGADSIIILSKVNGAADVTQFSASAEPSMLGGSFTFTANANATADVDYAFLVINKIA
jgi:hypothetical protein